MSKNLETTGKESESTLTPPILAMDNLGEEKKSGDQKVYALFQNLEQQGAALTYHYGGQLLTHEDGKEYLMTQAQVDHLNSLAVPIATQERDESGSFRTVTTSKRRRFSVMITKTL